MQKFRIDKLNCMSCVLSIQDALKELDEKIEVKADLKEKVIEVESNHSPQRLISVIEEAGYKASRY